MGAPAVWVAGSAAMIATVGMPTSHALVFAWLGLGMASFAVVELRRKLLRFVVDLLPFMGVLLVYDRLRGVADGLVAHPREVPQIKVETALFGKPIPTVRLQSHLWHGPSDLRWWDYACWLVYLTHFVATLLIAAVLWTWAHEHF